MKTYTNIEKQTSIHTKIGYYIGILAAIIQFFLAIRHIGDTGYGATFSQLCFLEGFFALSGILLIDLINGRGFKPKYYKKIDSNVLLRSVIILFVIEVIQITLQFVPLTIRDEEFALAIIFSAPSEELFFRGILISVFIQMGKHSKGVHLTKKKEISYMEIIGIGLSAVAFAGLHINYYNDVRIMLSVFIGGLALGFLFWWWRDLTACILGHLLLNIITVGQYFWMVNL